jgi:hypothetical protein
MCDRTNVVALTRAAHARLHRRRQLGAAMQCAGVQLALLAALSVTLWGLIYAIGCAAVRIVAGG